MTSSSAGSRRASGADLLIRRVARSTPRIPDPLLAPALQLTAALRGATPSLLAPESQRVLVIAPHPDDEAIGAGGLLALLARRGARIDAVLASDGEATIGPRLPSHEIGRRRRAEFVRSVGVLGGTSVSALGLPDGRLADHRADLAAGIAAALVGHRPDLVLAPWPLERHPDHHAVTVALLDALDAGAGPDARIWTYEVHTPIPVPSHVVDVTATVGMKRAALDVHVTAAEAFDLRACLGLAAWRSLATRAGRGAAEAFMVLDRDELREAVALVDAAVGA